MTALSGVRLRSRSWITVGMVVACLLFLASPQRSRAQEFRATLTGQVTDPDGRVVGKASVTAVNNETGSIYGAETSDAGVYYIPYVVPGTYTVTAKADGFKTAIQDKVLLLAGKYFAQNFTLQVGSFHETMEVTTAPPLLETADASGGTILDEKVLQNVPVNGRQVYMMIGTVPGSPIHSNAIWPRRIFWNAWLGRHQSIHHRRRCEPPRLVGWIQSIHAQWRRNHAANQLWQSGGRHLGHLSDPGCHPGSECDDDHL